MPVLGSKVGPDGCVNPRKTRRVETVRQRAWIRRWKVSHLIDHHRDPAARLVASSRAIDECILHGLAVESWCKRSLDAVDGIFWGLHCSILKSRAPIPRFEADGSPGNPHKALSTFVQSTRRSMGWIRFSVRIVKLIFGWLRSYCSSVIISPWSVLSPFFL
jgi:hypothetical protein